jgi:GNAT superfamily N-acetyltransferase
VKIRDARLDDAEAAYAVLRACITELCAADHGNDPVLLERWLANKQPEIVAGWIARTDSSVLVAIEEDTILAVGSVTDAGEITLNYVSPHARFRGVSRALLKALEARAVERGNTACRLHSTETAHRFYLANGYVDVGEPIRKFGMNSGYPMSKRITGPSDQIEVCRKAHELEAMHGRFALSYATKIAEQALAENKPYEHSLWKAVAAALAPR